MPLESICQEYMKKKNKSQKFNVSVDEAELFNEANIGNTTAMQGPDQFHMPLFHYKVDYSRRAFTATRIKMFCVWLDGQTNDFWPFKVILSGINMKWCNRVFRIWIGAFHSEDSAANPFGQGVQCKNTY